MQHLCTSPQMLQTKDLRKSLNLLDATLTQNRGYPLQAKVFVLSDLPSSVSHSGTATRHSPLSRRLSYHTHPMRGRSRWHCLEMAAEGSWRKRQKRRGVCRRGSP